MTAWRTVLMLPLLVTGLGGQTPLRAQEVGAGWMLQRYRFDDAAAAGLEEFRLLTLPFAASIDLGSNVSVYLAGTYADGEAIGPDGQRAKLSGVTDTEAGLSVRLGVDWLIANAGATLPTGNSALTTEESVVAGIVASELLPFAVRNWGTGGSIGGDLAIATQAGAWGIGFAGGLRLSSEYEPVPAQTLAYRPGDQLQFRFALDRDVAESGTLSVLLGFQRFSEDAISGSNLFRSGNRFEGVLSYAFALGLRSSALLYGGVYHRSNGFLLADDSVLGGAGDSPSQQLFMAGTNLMLSLGRRAAMIPQAEITVFRAEDGVGQGWVTTTGSTLDIRLAGNSSSARLILSPSGQIRFGHVTIAQGSESDFLGWEVGLTMRVETGR